MTVFLKRLAAFALFLAAVLFLADYLLSRYVRNANTYGMEVWRDIMEGKASADILILGDSRALNSCDREVLDGLCGYSAYNLAIIGNPFILQEFRYRMYRRHNSKPKLILLFVDEFTLNKAISAFDREQFYPWMWDWTYFKSIRHFSKEFVRRSVIPLYRYHGYRPWVLGKGPRLTRRGFHPFEDEVFHPEPEEEKAFGYRQETDRMFRDFIRNATREGIRVVLIAPPYHDSFRFKAGEKEKMEAYICAVADDCGVPFLNSSSLEMVHDSTLFLDRGHLNAKGARVYSDSLARYLTRTGVVAY